ncbi:hypothetical protein, partial [Staphylococcus aureus]
ASSYRLTSSAAGSYQLTRLSDGLVRNVNSGDIVDGFQLSFAPSAPAVGESYQIEPVSAAAVNMRTVLAAPTGIAAASPVTASTSV